MSVEDHGLLNGDTCKVYVCMHVSNSDAIHLHDQVFMKVVADAVEYVAHLYKGRAAGAK